MVHAAAAWMSALSCSVVVVFAVASRLGGFVDSQAGHGRLAASLVPPNQPPTGRPRCIAFSGDNGRGSNTTDCSGKPFTIAEAAHARSTIDKRPLCPTHYCRARSPYPTRSPIGPPEQRNRPDFRETASPQKPSAAVGIRPLRKNSVSTEDQRWHCRPDDPHNAQT